MIVQGVYDSDPRVRRKAEALCSAGYSVDVLALRATPGSGRYSLNGVSVHTLPLGKARGSLRRYCFEYSAFFLWAFTKVCFQMPRRKYCVIDVNTLPDFLVFAPVVGKLMGAKLVLDMHEITPEFYMSKYGADRHSWIVRALKWIERISFQFPHHVLTISEPIQRLLEERGLDSSRSTVIMNAADEARFTAVNPRPAVESNIIDEAFVMMYHGTLTKIYGLDIAVEAFALAHDRMPGAELWILGSGTESGALAAQVQENKLESKVRLVGQVPSSDIPTWLAQCSMGLLPLRQDVFLDFAFPNKLPEFVISGRPVLISRLKTIQHYFSERAVAYFEPNNPTDLATQMVRVFRDRVLRARYVARARDEYAPIRWEVMKERYVSLIDRLAEPRLQKATRVSKAAPGRA